MTKEKWTPGPWHVAPKKATYQVVGVAAESLIELGLPTEIEMASVGHRGGQAAAIPMDESSMANAHLISAVPDAVGLAKIVMDYCGDPKGISEIRRDELYDVALQFMKKARVSGG